MSQPFAFQHLLVGVDENQLATPAVHAAAMMTRAFSGELELIHGVPVLPPLWSGVDSEQLAELHSTAVARMRTVLVDRLRRMEEELGLPEGEMTARLRVVPGHPSRVLTERAHDLPADVVFLGAHQRRQVFDFGSTARAVFQAVPCGVWVQGSPFRAIQRILVPVDLSPDSLAALEAARTLAMKLEAELTPMYCFDPLQYYFMSHEIHASMPDESIAKMRDMARAEFVRAMADFDWQGVQHSDSFVEGPPIEQVLRLQSAFQLIVMGTHGHTRLARFLLGSMTYAVLRKAETPVLALHGSDCDTRF